MADRDDYQLARHLCLKPLGRLLGGKISDPAMRFHERLKSWASAGTFTTRDAVKHEKASDRAVRGWLTELHDAGKVDVLEGAKGPKPATWTLAVGNQGDDDQADLPTVDELFSQSGIPAFRQTGTA